MHLFANTQFTSVAVRELQPPALSMSVQLESLYLEALLYYLFWQIYILILYPSSENFTIYTTYHIMLFIVVVWHINVSSFCISLQIHSARAMRSESSSLLHFNIRQINEDSSEDATSLGRRQHCWEVFQVGSILFHF